MFQHLRRYRREVRLRGLDDSSLALAPMTFLLPQDWALLVEEHRKGTVGAWIFKPHGRSQGRGIFLSSRLSNVSAQARAAVAGAAPESDRARARSRSRSRTRAGGAPALAPTDREVGPYASRTVALPEADLGDGSGAVDSRPAVVASEAETEADNDRDDDVDARSDAGDGIGRASCRERV